MLHSSVKEDKKCTGCILWPESLYFLKRTCETQQKICPSSGLKPNIIPNLKVVLFVEYLHNHIK